MDECSFAEIFTGHESGYDVMRSCAMSEPDAKRHRDIRRSTFTHKSSGNIVGRFSFQYTHASPSYEGLDDGATRTIGRRVYRLYLNDRPGTRIVRVFDKAKGVNHAGCK